MLGLPVLNTDLAMECQDINSSYNISSNNNQGSIDFSNVEDLADFKYANVKEGFTAAISDDVVMERLAAGALMAAIPGVGWTIAANKFSSDDVEFGVVFKYRSKICKIIYSKQ